MKKNLAKRSLALLLSLLVVITASGVALAADWEGDLGASSATTQEAVLQSWDDDALAEKDGPYAVGASTGGKLTNLDYEINHQKMVGIQYYSDIPNNPTTTVTGDWAYDHCASIDFSQTPLPELGVGTTIRFFYQVYIGGVAVDSSVSRIGMYFRVYVAGRDKVIDGGGYNYDSGTYNNTSYTFQHNREYGYDYKTLYSSDVTLDETMLGDGKLSVRMFPQVDWDYQKHPVTIYGFGVQVKNGDNKYTQKILYSGEQLQPLIDKHPKPETKVWIKPVMAKKANMTAAGGSPGPYTVIGRRTTQMNFFSQTNTFFLFDDFIPRSNQALAKERKMDYDCSSLGVGDNLTVNFKIAVEDTSKFDTYRFKIVLKARVNTSDNVVMLDASLGSSMFSQGASQTFDKDICDAAGNQMTGERTSTTIVCTTVGTETINGESVPTYQFTASVINITQTAISQLDRAGSSSNGGLNLLLGVAAPYDYGAYPITLLMWEVAKATTAETKVYVKREGATVARFGGSGPAFEYVYKPITPQYDPDFMSYCYIPTGATFAADDTNANMTKEFPHAGEYTLRTDLQGDLDAPYTLQIWRKTITGDQLLKEDTFYADGKRKVESLTFNVEDIDDSYAFRIVNSTGNNLSVFSIELLCDAQASLDGTLYPELDWALEKATSGTTVTLVDEVDYSDRAAVAVPAGVTLDLAGHSLRVQNFISFGTVVDGQGLGDGYLVLVDRDNVPTAKAMVALQENNPQLPLYNSADGGYQFFTCTAETAGSVKTPAFNTIQFGFRVKLPTVEAYELLKENVDSGAVSLVATVTWNSTAFTYLHPVSKATMESYVSTVQGKINGGTPADSVKTAVTLKVSKVNHIGKGKTISCRPSLLSPLTGVTFQATGADEYTYQG